MERSSPLAAMQAPCLMAPWGFHQDAALARSQFAEPARYSSNSFNFKDLSMKRPSSDYFTMKPVRGSSPTASLAADLSQNFHIDHSPKVVTPRRSLFTSTLFGTVDGREAMTTPPLPSSSPGPANDSMDMSPLPHKPPYLVVAQRDVPPASAGPLSPTDTASMNHPPFEDSMAPPSGPATRDSSLLERRKPPFPRPSLARTKAHSMNMVQFRASRPETQLPPFRFGGGAKPSTTLTLGECFVESPPQERKMPFANPAVTLMGPPRPKQPFASWMNNARNGSPLNGHVRKQSTPAVRPRKVFRRSLSMFQHPDDVMREGQTYSCPKSGLQSVMDVDEPHTLVLPHFVPDDQPDSLPRITKQTLIDVLDGKYSRSYDQSIVVDCRFEYEYEGGHIDGAINYNDKESLASKLFQGQPPCRTLLIFHCEYSAHRAPIMAKFIRGQDRTANDHRYPELTYPEVYILEGGYSSFFGEHRARCFPQNYVEMDSKDHVQTCEREMGKLRHRKKLSRAQTFAFGQHAQQIEDSPTGPSRYSNDTMMAYTSQDENPRAHARRMASY